MGVSVKDDRIRAAWSAPFGVGPDRREVIVHRGSGLLWDYVSVDFKHSINSRELLVYLSPRGKGGGFEIGNPVGGDMVLASSGSERARPTRPGVVLVVFNVYRNSSGPE